MINRNQVVQLILEACPSFRDALGQSKDAELLYVVAGNFASHLLALYRAGTTQEFAAVAKMIEQLHLDGDSYVNELATIGILEGIQNTWMNNGEDPEIFCHFLLPESRKRWEALNDFWQGKTQQLKDELHNHIPEGIRRPADGSPKPSV